MTQKEIIEAINNLSNEKQIDFYNKLRESGFRDQEISTIQNVVFAYKICNDTYLYKTVVDAMAEEMYVEFNS